MVDWQKWDDQITRSQGYKFFMKHKKMIMMIQGIIIIGLLMGIWVYFYQDWQIKTQIRDTCGYQNNDWECVCKKEYVDFFKAEQAGEWDKINISFDSTKSLTNQDVQISK